MAVGKIFGFLVLLLNQQILERWECIVTPFFPDFHTVGNTLMTQVQDLSLLNLRQYGHQALGFLTHLAIG
jgi:hypothetical protein